MKIRKFRKPIAMFLTLLSLSILPLSCQRGYLEPESEQLMESNDALTSQQEDFLKEIDFLIENTLVLSESESNQKNSKLADPTNSNNPYDIEVKQFIRNTYACVLPHIKEAVEANSALCPIEDNHKCGETKEAPTSDVRKNVLKLMTSCGLKESGLEFDIPQLTDAEFLDFNINKESLIEALPYSNFGKKIIQKYTDGLLKMRNFNGIINLSIAFENKINNSNIMNEEESSQIVKNITSVKYSFFETYSFFDDLGDGSNATIVEDTAYGAAALVLGASFSIALTPLGGLAVGAVYLGVCLMGSHFGWS